MWQVLAPDQMGNRSGLEEIQKEKPTVTISKVLSLYNIMDFLSSGNYGASLFS